MFVYFSRNYTASATGTAVRDVHCEKCGCDYRYRLFRRGQGSAQSPYGLNNRGAERNAEKIAAKKLQKLLLYGVDPVPCPDCGWIQQEMVTELRRRSLRWLNGLAIALGIVFALIALIWLEIATKGFDREMHDGDGVVAVVIAVLMVLGVSLPLIIRRVLLKQRDPNRNYPQRPDPIPGTPKPFKAGEEDVVDALPEGGDDGLLSYQRLPPEVEPGGKITVQIARWPLPRVCCSCLREADRVTIFNAAANVKLPVRLCGPCASRCRRRSAMWLTGGALLLGAIGYGLPYTQQRPDQAIAIGLAALGALLGLAIGAGSAQPFARAVRFSRFNGPLNTIRVRFTNPNYTAVFIAEPPPAAPNMRSPLDVIPPPPARSSLPRPL